jgi:hypothetical protein
MTTTRRTPRPMIQLTGKVSDLREGDYVDTLGGGKFRFYTVSSLVHSVTHRPAADVVLDFLSRPVPGLGLDTIPAQEYHRPASTSVTFVNGDTLSGLIPSVPVTFRRFTD